MPKKNKASELTVHPPRGAQIMKKLISTKRTDMAVLLKEKSVEYGQEILQSLIAKLSSESGRRFWKPIRFRMVRFSEIFPDPKIVAALRRQSGWTI